MKTKKQFTSAEISSIEDLVRRKCNAPGNEQKAIRDRIREIGFYWSDFSQYAKVYAVNFNVNIFHVHCSPFLFLNDCLRLTLSDTSSALNTLCGIDCKGCELVTGSDVVCSCDSVCGTLLCTHTASDTLVLENLELEELLTYACRTLLINDMSNVLISEVTNC